MSGEAVDTHSTEMCRACPRHILIIPDGNRRFAKSNCNDIYEAYETSSKKITEVIEWVFAGTDCRTLSIFALGADNVKHRHSEEIDAILRACSNEFLSWAGAPIFGEMGIKIQVIGDMDGMPDYFLRAKEAAEQATRNNTIRKLNILAGYSGRMDIKRAAKLTAPDEEEDIIKNMLLKEYIDMIIRTSSVMRVSDCPLYQMAYSELVFIDKLFPEIEKEDISQAFSAFSTTKRNMGS